MNIEGPTGILEADYRIPDQPCGVQAVLCHPHPQYGGSMHDRVLDCLARVLLDRGAAVLRFNFRGVGASDGRYANGDGEVDDLLAAAAWLRSQAPDDRLWAGGYSFGAFVAWRSLGRGLDAERLLLVAPPLGHMDFSAGAAGIPVDVFAGDADEFVDQQALAAWEGVRAHTLAGADHFFMGQLNALAADIRRVIA